MSEHVSEPLKITSLLIQPASYFRSPRNKLVDGLGLILVLILTTFVQKWLLGLKAGDSSSWNGLLISSVINSLGTWAAMSVFFYVIVLTFHYKTNFWQFCGAMGSASLPLSIANILSILFLLVFYREQWLLMQNIFAWIGMAAGWPGYYCYLVNTEMGMIPKKWAIGISAAAFLLLFGSYWLPAV